MRDGSKPAMVFAKLGRFHDPTRRKLIISGAPTRIHSFCSLVGGGSGENIFATCQFVAVRSREATQNPQNLLWWTVKVLFYWRIVQINVCRYTSFQYSSNRNLSEKSCGPISAHSPSAFQNTQFSGPLRDLAPALAASGCLAGRPPAGASSYPVRRRSRADILCSFSLVVGMLS